MTITNGKVDLFLETGHSLLGPSSAKRWLTCTPSARLGENIPDTGGTSPYALEGTAAHHFAEIRLLWKLGGIDFAEYRIRLAQAKEDFERQIAEWSHYEWEAIDEYVLYCQSEVERLGGNYLHGGDAIWGVEQTVDFSEIVPMGKGTADFTIVNHKMMIIKAIDLKFGKGIAVDARDNEQAKLYALGLVCDLDGTFSLNSYVVEWAIVQPRLNYIGEDWMPLADLVEWAENYVKPRAQMAWDGVGELVPSDEACRYCRVAPTCRARFEHYRDLALSEFGVEFTETYSTDGEEESVGITATVTRDPYTITAEDMGEILPRLDAWIAWANSVQARALVMARDEGIQIPGYKIVRGRSNRGWDKSKPDLENEVVTRLVAEGYDEDAIFEPPKPRALKSVAQLEKVTGKTKFPKLVGDLVVKPLGTPALVPESDPREAVTPEMRADEALADFGDLNEETGEVS